MTPARWIIKARAVARETWQPVTITVLSLLAGLLGSLYTTDIRGAFPFTLDVGSEFPWVWNRGAVSWPTVVFWACALAAASLFGSAQVRERGERRGDHAELVEVSDRLSRQAQEHHDQLRSLPPKYFLSTFQGSTLVSHAVFTETMAAYQQRSTAQIRTEIQALLEGLVTLVQGWERAHSTEGRWAANVMTFVPLTDGEAEIERFRAVLPYSALPLDAKMTRGFLLLRPELSVVLDATRSGTAAPDPAVRRIALPVPHCHRTADERLFTMLPGAPQAFCERDFVGYADTRTMADWCRIHCDLPQDVVEQVALHFAPGAHPYVRSLLTLPLPGKPGIGLYGVVNIHLDRPGMAASDGAAGSLLYPVLTPILAMIRELCTMYDMGS